MDANGISTDVRVARVLRVQRIQAQRKASKPERAEEHEVLPCAFAQYCNNISSYRTLHTTQAQPLYNLLKDFQWQWSLRDTRAILYSLCNMARSSRVSASEFYPWTRTGTITKSGHIQSSVCQGRCRCRRSITHRHKRKPLSYIAAYRDFTNISTETGFHRHGSQVASISATWGMLIG